MLESSDVSLGLLVVLLALGHAARVYLHVYHVVWALALFNMALLSVVLLGTAKMPVRRHSRLAIRHKFGPISNVGCVGPKSKQQ